MDLRGNLEDIVKQIKLVELQDDRTVYKIYIEHGKDEEFQIKVLELEDLLNEPR